MHDVALQNLSGPSVHDHRGLVSGVHIHHKPGYHIREIEVASIVQNLAGYIAHAVCAPLFLLGRNVIDDKAAVILVISDVEHRTMGDFDGGILMVGDQ